MVEYDEWPKRDARPIAEVDTAGGLLVVEGTMPKVAS